MTKLEEALVNWIVGHPDRDPCYCLATGELVRGRTPPRDTGDLRELPRFLLAVRVAPDTPHSWRLWDRSAHGWISDDLGTDRDVARDQAETIIAEAS